MIKKIGYFEPSLNKGDIIKTSTYWAIVDKAYSYDDVSFSYSYKIIEGLNDSPKYTAYPDRINEEWIEIAFSSGTTMNEIRYEFPEFFV